MPTVVEGPIWTVTRVHRMHETRSRDGTVEVLRRFYGDALSGLIAIDGTDGVGKTPLALGLQEVLGGTVISLDDFVLERAGGYVPFLRVAELRSAIHSCRRPCIVEGVCALAALGRVSQGPDVLIYVKRLGSDDYWHQKDTCDPNEPVDELIDRLATEVAMLARFDPEEPGDAISKEGKPSLTPLREEVIRYHARYRPSRRADITFVSMEDA